MLIHTSMSGLGRVEKCLPSVILSRTSKEPGPWATRGQSIHRYLSLVPTVGREAALALIEEEHRSTCEVIELDRLPLNPNQWAAEVAWALNWREGTAREIGRGLERDYDGKIDPACEIPGAADVVGVTATHAIVLDYKSGFADQGAPANSWQLKTYALALARAENRDSAFVGFIRLRVDGTPWFDAAELGPLELDRHEIAVRALMLRAEAAANDLSGARGPLVFHEGGWCKLCPAFASCDAKVKLAAAMVRPDVAEGGVFSLPMLSEENVPALLERLDAVSEVLKRVKASVREFALYRSVPMGDGKFYGAVEVTTETIEVAVGGKVIAGLYGAEVADNATKIEQSMPWTALEEALRPRLAAAKAKDPKTKDSMAGYMREARDVLRQQNGALSTKYRTDVKIHKPAALPAPRKSPPKKPPDPPKSREPGEDDDKP